MQQVQHHHNMHHKGSKEDRRLFRVSYPNGVQGLTWDGFKCIVPTVTFTAPMLWWNQAVLCAMEYWSNMERYGYSVMKSFLPSEEYLDRDDY